MSAVDNKKPKLYYMPESPPCRTVMLVARMLNIELDYELLDLSQKQQLNSPEFVAINPFHVVPTLVDTDGFALWESRVIASYLIETRAPESSLYPVKDVKRRATIDKFLHYDLGTFYRALGDVIVSCQYFPNYNCSFNSNICLSLTVSSIRCRHARFGQVATLRGGLEDVRRVAGCGQQERQGREARFCGWRR